MKPGIACDDGVAAHFVDGELFKFVSSRESVKAYYVRPEKDQTIEEAITPEFLND